MHENIDFDSLLFRQVASGKEFENLIPKTTCKKVASGIGDTSYSMQQMAEMVKEYSYQVNKVAHKLQTSSLKNTLENVKEFIYSHFQYKADLEDQLLRSPACSWHDRHAGIDCKSYSILASCILTELGITHYIRRIKQPGYAPTEYTHVYVVVPYDQTNGNLSKGYYTIDGTLEYDNEPAFINKDDIKMSLQHYKLNGYYGMGSTPDQEPPTQTSSTDKSTLKTLLKQVSIKNIKKLFDIFKSLDCIGGSAYDKNDRDRVLDAMNVYFTNLIIRINESVVDNDDEKFARAVNEFYSATELGFNASSKRKSEGWNSCSTKVLTSIVEAWKFYNVVVTKSLTVWLDDNFIKKEVSPEVITFKSEIFKKEHKIDAFAENLRVTKPLQYFEPKPKQIQVFEISKYVQDTTAKDISAFNPIEFIESLSNTLATFKNPSTSTGNGTNLDNGTGTNTLGNNTTQTAGFGTIGWIILGVGATLFITGMKTNTKNNPKK